MAVAGVALLLAVSSCTQSESDDPKSGNAAGKPNGEAVHLPWPTKSEVPKLSGDPVAKQIAPQQLEELKRQALGGDAESAKIVMLYVDELKQFSEEQKRFWRVIAAENGDAMAASLLAVYLENDGGNQNCLRAKFWFTRALDLTSGNREASATIKGDLDALSQNWNQCLARGDPESHR